MFVYALFKVLKKLGGIGKFYLYRFCVWVCQWYFWYIHNSFNSFIPLSLFTHPPLRKVEPV